MVDGTISSQCCVLNSEERLKLVRKANEVAAILAEIEIERIKRKEEVRKEKADKEAKKEERRKLRMEKNKQKEKEAKEVCEKTMNELAEKGAQHISKLTVKILKDLIRYVFGIDDWKDSGIRKPALKAIVECEYATFIAENRGPFIAAAADNESAEEENIDVALLIEDSSDDDEDDVDAYVGV